MDSPQSASPLREEQRRSDRGAQRCAYARPGPSTAATPVDLAAAIAQQKASGPKPAAAETSTASERTLTAALTNWQQSYDGSSELAVLPLPDSSSHATTSLGRGCSVANAITRQIDAKQRKTSCVNP